MEDIKDKILSVIVMIVIIAIFFTIGACSGVGIWFGLKCIFFLKVGPLFAAIVGGIGMVLWFLKKVKK